MNTINLNRDLTATKPHFAILDGLRGIAALAVVIFHYMEWIFTDINNNFIGHGFLAVDFFFCLSGFVIGYAYDNRIAKMGAWEFFKSRLIRLHPLIIIGSVLGLICFLIDPFATPTVHGAGRLILLFVCSLLLIPLPIMEERAFNLFGFNAPSWSLFWEYVANIFYALVLYRLGRRSLMLLTLLAAVGIFMVSDHAGNLLGGWSKDNFFDGGARVAFSFLAGLLLYRSNWIIKNTIGFWSLSFLLALAFIMPGTQWNWLTEALVVIFYFPLLVSLGAGSALSDRRKKLCKFLGDISYPLYMTHYAGIWIYGNYFTNKNPPTEELAIVIGLGIVVQIVIAYLIMKYIDMPIREYFTNKRKQPIARAR